MRKMLKGIALLMALALLSGLALAEGALESLDAELDFEDTESLNIDEAPSPDVVGEMPVDIELSLGELDLKSHVTYRFIVDDEEYASLEAQAGEEVLRPADPEAPKGKVFTGWALADGTPLFVNADGKNEPVIAQDYEMGTEVYVWAVFADEAQAEEAPAEEEPAEEPVTEAPVEEQPAEEEPTEEELAEEPAEEEPVEEAPAEEEPAEEAPVEEQPAEEEPAVEDPVTDEPAGDAAEASAAEQPAAAPVANALVYNGEAQALVSAGEGWLFSTDGENFTADIPTATDAGDYTVYFAPADADAEAQALVVTVAKADVVLIPPEAMNGEA